MTKQSRESSRKINIRLIVIIIAMIYLALNAYHIYYTESNIPGKLKPFTSLKNGYSILLPSGWLVDENTANRRQDPYSITFVLHSGFTPVSTPIYMYIARNNFSDGSLDRVVDWGKERAIQRGGYSLISSTDFNTSRYKGKLIEYLFAVERRPDLTATCKEWYILEQEWGYGIELCTDQKQWPKLDKPFTEIINSFKIN